MANAKYNIELINAVSALYDKKVISKDKDIVDKMRPYKKNTVSGYIRGTVKASDTFLKKFEEVFELKLSDYGNNLNKALPLGEINITVADYIAKLEGWNSFLQGVTSSNLAVLSGGQQVLYSFVRTILEYQAAKSNAGNMKMEELDLRSLRSMLVKNHLVNVTEEKALEVDKLGSNVDRP